MAVVVTEGDITEVDIMGDATVGSMAVIAESPFTTECQDSEAASLRVTGRMVITIPIRTTVCAKDGFQLATITWKADKIQIPAPGIRFRCQTDIGKMFPANSSSPSVLKRRSKLQLLLRKLDASKIRPCQGALNS